MTLKDAAKVYDQLGVTFTVFNAQEEKAPAYKGDRKRSARP